MIKLFGGSIRFLIRTGVITLGVLVAGFFVYLSVTIMWQGNRNTVERAESIIVLTGGKGRIEAAFDLLLDNKANELLISGVNNETTLADIIRAQDISPRHRAALLDHCCITLDYAADTTEANAREATTWVRDNNMHSIILVTASYHMPRAALLFKRSLPDADITLFPVRDERRAVLAVSKDYWILAAREYSKYLGSWVRIHNQEQEQQ